MISVQPKWCLALSLQQQSVLMLATRGPDGIAKNHPSKIVHAAYRGTVLVSAKYGRCLTWEERADSFMSLNVLADDIEWQVAVRSFFKSADELPHHYLSHLMHGAEIIGYKHPDSRFADRWNEFYLEMVHDLHLRPELSDEMDDRLGDWNQQNWDK